MKESDCHRNPATLINVNQSEAKTVLEPIQEKIELIQRRKSQSVHFAGSEGNVSIEKEFDGNKMKNWLPIEENSVDSGTKSNEYDDEIENMLSHKLSEQNKDENNLRKYGIQHLKTRNLHSRSILKTNRCHDELACKDDNKKQISDNTEQEVHQSKIQHPPGNETATEDMTPKIMIGSQSSFSEDLEGGITDENTSSSQQEIGNSSFKCSPTDKVQL